MRQAYICDAIRTPIGRYGGALSSIRADDLGAMPLRALLARSPRLDPCAIDDVFYGCANQAGEDNSNVARRSLLLAGLPSRVPGVTLNRLCASGLEAVGQATRGIRSHDLSLAIAGGVESMTRAPLVVGRPSLDSGSQGRMQDSTVGWRFVNPRLQAMYGTETLAQTGENVAREYRISREEQDAFALRSQRRAASAQASGFLAEEIMLVDCRDPDTGASHAFSVDEQPHPDATAETLAALRPLYRGGSVTEGNASSINDGAAAMIIASEEAVRVFDLTPRAFVLGMASAGVDPRVMGMGPVPAVRKLMARLALSIDEFDAIELNEAFASQSLAVLRALGLPDDAPHVNANGGAIALGSPLGMSGVRMVATLVHQLERMDGKLGLVAQCVGAGMGLALAVELI